MKVFPTRRFYFTGVSPDIERRTVSGGTSISGEEDLVETDGGGRVVVEFTEAYLDAPEAATAWRAISAQFGSGTRPIIVPLGDAKHQMMGDVTTPIGGLPWWEESDFTDSEPHATLTATAALRATTISVDVSDLAKPVRPGIWLSIDHATYRHRAYPVAEVLSDDGATALIKIGMPLREATASGTPAEFYDPKCTMRVDGGMGSPVTFGYAEGSVRFVEYFGDIPA